MPAEKPTFFDTYMAVANRAANIDLVIVGKDPFKNDPTGVAFCKPNWKLQYAGNSSGMVVLKALGIKNTSALRGTYTTPFCLFCALANQGIVFLNASYEYLGGKALHIVKHQAQLAHASEINRDVLARTKKVLLCGQAKLVLVPNKRRGKVVKVVHPSKQNSTGGSGPETLAQWNKNWSLNGKQPHLKAAREIVRNLIPSKVT